MGLLSHLICVATTRRRSNYIGCLITVMINSLRVMTVSTRPNLDDMSGVRVQKFHDKSADLIHDLSSHPEYARANVLLSTDFRYFGIQGTDEYKSKYELIRRAVEGLGRGQRVNLSPELRKQFLAMKKSLWGRSESKVLGRPTSGPSSSSCHRSKFCAVL
jgi:hypothetical protein